MQVTNPSPTAPLYATIDDTHYEIAAGASIDVDERTAMLLGEYGAIVNRAQIDEALPEVFTPFSEHGPGTDDTGRVIDQAAQDAFVEATGGDTSKTPGKVADLSTGSTVVAERTVDTLVSSEAGTVDETAADEQLAEATEAKVAKATAKGKD